MKRKIQITCLRQNNSQFSILNSDKGVSLIELVVVIATVSSIVFLMANIPNSLGLITKSKNLSLAREIGTKQLEDIRVTNYLNLVLDDPVPISDQRLTLLPQGKGSVLIKACPLEICTNGESLKQVSVTVEWQENNKNQKITLKTLLGEGGLGQ